MKRINIPGAAYLVTTFPVDRIPFFNIDVISDTFIKTLVESQKTKQFYLVGYKINPEHIHLIIQISEKHTLSQIIHNIKRISSLKINQIISIDDDVRYRTLSSDEETKRLRKVYREATSKHKTEFPLFKWQKSFYDRIIRSSKEMSNSINYLKKQTNKHGLSEEKWLCINTIPNDILYPG